MAQLEFLLCVVVSLCCFNYTTAENETLTVEHCFSKMEGRAIANTFAVMELSHTYLSTCLSRCINLTGNYREGCMAVVYSEHSKSCKLYRQSGVVKPAFLIPAYGSHYYTRVKTDGPLGNCSSPQGQLPPVASTVPSGSTVPPTPAPATHSCPVNSGYLIHVMSQVTFPAGGADMSASYSDVTLTKCAELCTLNIDPNDKTQLCGSFNYDHGTQNCEVHFGAATPHGDGTQVAAPASIYAEKFCLPAEAPSQCGNNEIFLFHPNKDLKQHKLLDTTNATTARDCLSKCIVTENCKSVVFKGAGVARNCDFHSIHLDDDPSADVTSEFVLIENGCHLQGRRRFLNIFRDASLRNHRRLTELNSRPLNQKLQSKLLLGAEEADDKSPPPVVEQSPPPANRHNQFNNAIESRKNDPQPTSHAATGDWNQWTPCQFMVKSVTVRVRTRTCSIFDCLSDSLQVEKCS